MHKSGPTKSCFANPFLLVIRIQQCFLQSKKTHFSQITVVSTSLCRDESQKSESKESINVPDVFILSFTVGDGKDDSCQGASVSGCLVKV